MSEYSPHDPLRCGLNSTTSNTLCIVIFGAVRQFPQGFGTGVALQLHGLAFSVCYLPSCGLCAMGGWVGAQNFLSTVSRRLAWRGLCGSDESLQPDETVVGAAHSCWLGHCSYEHMPNDPLRCGLNSTTSYTRCFVLTGAVRQFPARVWHGCCLATS